MHLSDYGAAFCRDGETAVDTLGRVLEQARQAGVSFTHPHVVAAEAFHAKETSFWTRTLVTLPGTGGCESFVDEANGHINRLNALISAMDPRAPQYGPAPRPPPGDWASIVKMGLTAAIVLGVAYVGAPIAQTFLANAKRRKTT